MHPSIVLRKDALALKRVAHREKLCGHIDLETDWSWFGEVALAHV